MRPGLLRPFLLLLLIAPVCSRAQSLENSTIEREEYAVYSAIIVEYAFYETGTFVIANPTTNLTHEPTMASLQFRVPSTVLLQETFKDFIQRNRTNRWLMPKLEMDRKYVLVDYREILKLANDMEHPNTAAGQMMEEWKPFFKEYPSAHGFVSLSRVGFNHQLDQALVNIGWRCPSLCGHWSYLLLTKKDGVWKVVNEANRIVS
jgi:hypothetical protein